ncbi:RICIN domain-containing protein [Streptomyces rubellomurinus]|uniref:RICIN domain-containing protein n=1 Tax=Streptomyces rubellomurinus (strain ATCC 31215) TaxID=359131 RepID=UPI00099DF0A5|nr:RICIN domain-containing protein [Streptomyces rubellomurinus]
MNETDPAANGRGRRRARPAAGGVRRPRGRHRRRWTTLGLALGVPGVLGPYLLFVQADSRAASVDPDAYYTLVSVRSDKALDVPGADTADGAWIRQMNPAAGAASQQWRLRLTGDGSYELENRGSHKVLGVRGNSAQSAAAIEQQTDHAAPAQQWRMRDVGDGTVTFASGASGLVLDVWGGGSDEGVPLIQYADHGGSNQRWRLVKVAGAGGYTWHNAQIVGGGFVTGLVFNPSRKDLLYARTDIGGAYRWDAAAGRWTSLTDWIGGGDWNLLGIESLATDPVDPNRLYLASGTYTNDWAGNGAILRSTDQGRTFQRTDLPFKLGGNEDGRSMGERLVVDPSDNRTLYLGTRKNGLWRSTDYGATWSQVGGFPVKDGASSGVGLSFVTFGPAGSRTIYVGAADRSASLYRSTDGGATWQAVPGQPTGQLPQHGVLSGDGSLYLTYTDAPGPNGVTAGSVWKYAPSTGVWRNVSPSSGGYGFAGLAVDPQHPATVMVSTLDRWWPSDELYRSTDGGASWKALGASSQRDDSAAPYVGTGIGHWMGALTIDPFDSGHVLYGTGSGMWGSTDVTAADSGRPTHWNIPAKGLEETATLALVKPPGQPLISALGDVSGFRHEDLTKVPAKALSGPLFTNTTGIDFAQRRPEFVVRVGLGGAQHGAWSGDGGANWAPFATAPVGDAGGGSAAVSADGGTVVWTPAGRAPFLSTDRGASWSAVSGLPRDAAVVADRSAAGTFYALSGGTLYASTDGGWHFAARATGLGDGQLRAVPGVAGDLWIAGGGNGLRHSTDGGASFRRLDGVAQAGAVGFGKAAPGAGYQALYLSGKVKGVTGLFRSTDGGSTWTRINDDQHQFGGSVINVVSGDPDVYGRVYLGGYGRGVVYGDPS